MCKFYSASMVIFLTITSLFASLRPFEIYCEELRENFLGVRPAGMGNAFTSFADDENSVWTNPAGIARVRKARSRNAVSLFTMPSWVMGGNAGGEKFLRKSLGKPLSTGASVLEDILADAESASGDSIWVRMGIATVGFFDAPRGSPWAAGFVSNVKSKIISESAMDGLSEPIAVIDSVTDVGGVMTAGWTNRSNRINMGLQLRPTLRYGYYDKIPLSDILPKFKSKIQEDSNNGVGVGIDVGFMWTMADYWFPSLGLVVKNIPTGCIDDYLNTFEEKRQRICGSKFGGTINNPESPYLLDPTDIRMGLSISPRISRDMTIRFAADLHHLYLTTDNVTYYGLPGVEPLKNLHAGAELYFGNPLEIAPMSFRVGFNQGFSSFGATLRLAALTLECAMIESDISSKSSGVKDQRFLANISLQFH